MSLRRDETTPRSVRVPAPISERLQEVAEREDRTITQQINHYIRRGLSQDGALPPFPPPP